MFKRVVLVFIFIVLWSSGIFAKSRIIISGNSSIIVESTDNNTNILAGKIETMSGGTINRTNIQIDKSETIAEDSYYNELPTEFVIEKVYPNPFNPTTSIRYGVSTTSTVNIAIYDMMGRLVSDYKVGNKEPGWYEFTWHGNDSHGQQVSTGMYLITMRAGEHFQKQKVTFLK